MSYYTPTTQEILAQWREQRSYNHAENGKEARDAQFGRWLAQYHAEVAKTERERIIALLTENGVLRPAENFDSEVIALIKGENE